MKENQPYNIQQLFDKLLASSNRYLDDDIELSIDEIVKNSEKQKAVLTVIITGLVYKYYHPEQDIRYHQSNMEGGYSGRSFDKKWITPFLKVNNFPHMSESGWLTRSLEQNLPYTQNYPGKISNSKVKKAFLQIYDRSQDIKVSNNILFRLFQKLVQQRDTTSIKLLKPKNLTIKETINLIKQHFEFSYKNTSGSSRLPHLAIYAVYECIIENNSHRYRGKRIIPISSHTASDKSTGHIGDIQINDSNNQPFEGLEIKARPVGYHMIEDIYRKIQEYETVTRYYFLSTCNIENTTKIEQQINQIRSKHGCEVIVNGVYKTLTYFLRLCNTDRFIQLYSSLIEKDEALKYEHKHRWNDLCSML